METIYKTEPDFSLYTMDPYNKSRNNDFWHNSQYGGPLYDGVRLGGNPVSAPKEKLDTVLSK